MGPAVLQVVGDDVLHVKALVHHGRHAEPQQANQGGQCQQQREHDAGQAEVEPALVLQEVDHGIEQIGYHARYEERHHYGAEIAEQEPADHHGGHDEQAAGKTVEGNRFHIVSVSEHAAPRAASLRTPEKPPVRPYPALQK